MSLSKSMRHDAVAIEEEKHIMTDTFLSYGLHMTRSKSDHT
jgi:hypothetical protein